MSRVEPGLREPGIRGQVGMALPLGAQRFTAMADAPATAWGAWVGWS